MVYSRSATLPEKYVPRIKESFAKAGVDFNKFKVGGSKEEADPSREGSLPRPRGLILLGKYYQRRPRPYSLRHGWMEGYALLFCLPNYQSMIGVSVSVGDGQLL